MIRLLHFADTHLGVESYGKIDPATGLSTRMGDFVSTLDEMVEYALNEGIHLVVFAGDAYRTRDPNQTYQREFARRIGRLSKAGIAVFLLVGNHDLPVAVGRANSVDIFETLAVDNVYVGRVRNVQVVETRGGRVQIVAVPWLMKNLLLSRDEFKNKTVDEINQLMVDATAYFVEQAAARLDPALPTVLVGHASVLGATVGSEKSITLGQDFVLPKSVIGNDAFDYVALGHIHKHQVLSYSPLTIYSGSLNRVDFGEEKEDKGFVVVDLEKGSADYKFVPVNARRFVTIEVDADCDNPTERIVSSIEQNDVQDAIVRVLIKTSAEREAQIRYQDVRRGLRDAYYVASISRQVERQQRAIFSERLAEEMTPREALEMFLKNKQVPAERQAVLLKYADNVMAGKE